MYQVEKPRLKILSGPRAHILCMLHILMSTIPQETVLSCVVLSQSSEIATYYQPSPVPNANSSLIGHMSVCCLRAFHPPAISCCPLGPLPKIPTHYQFQLPHPNLYSRSGNTYEKRLFLVVLFSIIRFCYFLGEKKITSTATFLYLK